jgi:NADPH:quinone reductase-like Zn-dependent oxidoreductase
MNDRTTTTILIERHGAPEVLTERTVPVRSPGVGEVRLSVRAAGVNFADLVMREGLYATVPPIPYAPGFEVAGEIEAVGDGVPDWQRGERAAALVRFGGYASALVVPSASLFRYPERLSFVEAAAVPVAFLTAWVCLFEAARARGGETALVLGAAGGVGSAAVQLARAHGLRAIGTAGTPAKARVVTERLGAVACLDSRGDWESQVRSVVGDRQIDVALDPIGGRATAACRRLMAPLGRLVFYGLSDAVPGVRRNWLRAAWAWIRTPLIHPYALVEPNLGVLGVHLLHLADRESVLRSALPEIYAGIESGRWQPVVDRTYPLSREGAVAAHRRLHARENIGKVVLTA